MEAALLMELLNFFRRQGKFRENTGNLVFEILWVLSLWN